MSTTGRAAFAGRVNQNVFYGWVMVAIAGMGIFASGPGQSHTFSVFVGPISEDLGISQTVLASAYAIATLGAAFVLPYLGKIVDQWGARLSLIGIVSILGLACLFFGAASGYLWLALGFGFLRFFGQGAMMLGSANLVSQWFSAKRGFALSLMALGFGLSMAVHPNLGQYLIDTMGWRQAWYTMGIITWALMLPPLILLVFDKPEDLGLAPDNAEVQPDAPTPALTGLTLGEALRHPTFYLAAISMFFIAMLVTTLHYHQFNILTTNGLGGEWAGRSFTISAVVMVAAMPLVGKSLDRFKTRYVFAAALMVQASSLVLASFATDINSLLIYAVVFGVNNAFSMTMFGYVWPRFFGRLHLGRIQGTGQMIAVVGASLGPIPISIAFDVWGDPSGMLHTLALAPIGAAIAVFLFLRTPEGVEAPVGLE